MDDLWVGLGPDGSWIEKRPWTESIRAGTTHYDAVELSNLHVRFPRPDLAVVTGDFMQKAHSGPRDKSMTGRYVDTWARTGERWHVVSSGFAPRRDPKADAAQVEALERAWVDVAIRGDADAFARYMTDDYVASSGGRILTKSAWGESLRAKRSTFSRVEFRNVSVRVHGDAAVFIADFDQVATANGVDNSVSGTEITTWVRDGGSWRAAASGFSHVSAR